MKINPYGLTLVIFLLPINSVFADYNDPSKFSSTSSTVKQKQNQQVKEIAEPPQQIHRGQLLYENHCHVCHDSEVHVREKHRAKSKDEIKYWVIRWSNELKLKWSSKDVNDVVDYLAKKYYSLD